MAVDRCDVLCLDLELAERLRRNRIPAPTAARAARSAKRLGDPTRLTIAAALLSAEELCVCDLAWVVERDEALVSHHARALRDAGLAASRRDGKMVMYSLTPHGRAVLSAVLACAEERAPA